MRLAAVLAAVLVACLAAAPVFSGGNDSLATRYSVDVVSRYPHDPKAFTQGLLYAGGYLYESTGQRGHSTLRRVALETGEVLAEHRLDDQYFAEGLALAGDRLIQLTWQAGKGFVYHRDSLELIEEFSYDGEGWGLTYDGKQLIMSDGSARLRLLDPESFQQTSHLDVTYQGQPLKLLNELEMVEGEIWANIWRYDLIVRIDPVNGNVIGAVLAGDLRRQVTGPYKLDVLNGIAYDQENQRLFVTGKYWPAIFSIKLREMNNNTAPSKK